MGIAKPNYTQVPNQLLDDLMPIMGGSELRVTLALSRQTFGYHRESADISLADLEQMTGLSRQGVINGINAGLERGTIERNDGRRGGYVYSLLINGNVSTSQQSGLVNKVDQSTSQKNGLVDKQLVNEVDQSDSPLVKTVDQTSQISGLELVNEVDLATPTLNKEKETIKELTEEKEEPHAPDPLSVAWRQTYTDVPMPPALAKSLQSLVAECGMAATIHGIKASAGKPEGRNFKYIAECARNYVPPPSLASYANGNPYTVNVPGIVPLPVNGNGHSAPPLPRPMPTDDPWSIAVAELTPVLSATSAARWLQGSRLEPNGELAGVPFYRVVLTADGADAGWMMQQAEPAIRKKVASLLGKRIQLEIVTMHLEPTP